jgi:hypothetical protein
MLLDGIHMKKECKHIPYTFLSLLLYWVMDQLDNSLWGMTSLLYQHPNIEFKQWSGPVDDICLVPTARRPTASWRGVFQPFKASQNMDLKAMGN